MCIAQRESGQARRLPITRSHQPARRLWRAPSPKGQPIATDHAMYMLALSVLWGFVCRAAGTVCHAMDGRSESPSAMRCQIAAGAAPEAGINPEFPPEFLCLLRAGASPYRAAIRQPARRSRAAERTGDPAVAAGSGDRSCAAGARADAGPG
jgi:hypothetical protein